MRCAAAPPSALDLQAISYRRPIRRPFDSAQGADRQICMDTTIKDFEAALAELDTIVKKLEEGDLPLESSLQLYERGVQLSRFCHARLEEAERRIEVLNERGQLTTSQNLKLEGDK